MSTVQFPRPKHQQSLPASTHIRIYETSLKKLRKLAEAWKTSLPEALRYVIDLAEAGKIKPEEEETQES